MSIICGVDLGTAQKYRGKSLSTKYNGKKHKVYLKLLCDDTNLRDGIELAKQSKNILMVSYQGAASWDEYAFLGDTKGVYVGYVIDLGVDVSEDDISRAVDGIPASVTPIINLPKSFTDMEFIWRVSKKFPRARFSGGQLFAVEGTHIGEVGVDILQRSDVKFGVECYRLTSGVDALESANISGLEIDMSGKAESTTRQRSSSSPKKSDNIRSRIGALFLNGDFEGL